MNRFFTSIGLVLLATASYAGPITSGGGKAVVCYDDAGQIRSATLLDLYEGRVAFGDRHARGTDTYSYLALARERLEQTGYSLLIPNLPSVERAIVHVSENLNVLPEGTALEDIDDSFEFVVPTDCAVKQLAHFVDEENIVVRSDIWNAMSDLDRAGLILHEAIYWIDRQIAGAQDSRRSRRVVSQSLAAEWKFVDVKTNLPESYTWCQSSGNYQGGRYQHLTAFAVYPKDSFQIVQFLAINGDLLLSETVAATSDFPFLDPADINGSYTANLPSSSAYENGHRLSFDRHAVLDAQGLPVYTVLQLSTFKDSYPSWEMRPTQIMCSTRN